ncbi:unnamed protein product [marine sediment metagenome]|uniref:Methyltransferase type 11 domain-containing protein n=1 Tax=marine sediment metagenome TaxID=412755 RepID=X1EE27_9ZZZZ
MARRMTGLVIDIGSGEGIYRDFMDTSSIVRLDIEMRFLDGDEGYCVLADAAYLPFINSIFEGVWACALIEHVAEETIPEFIRVSKPGGNICVLTPNKYSPKDIIRKFFGRSTWIDREGHVRLYTVCNLIKYGKVYGEIWGLPFLDPILKFFPWLGDTIMLHFTVVK